MERHGRRQQPGRRTARQRAGQKLIFESLERRCLLSVAGFVQFSPPVVISPPAIVGEIHPRLAAAIDMLSARSTDLPSRSPLATMDAALNVPGSDRGFASDGRDIGDRGNRISPSSVLSGASSGTLSNEVWPLHFGAAPASPDVAVWSGATQYGALSGNFAAHPAAVVSLYEPPAIAAISLDTSSTRPVMVVSYTTNLSAAPLVQHAVMESNLLDGQNGPAGTSPAAVDRTSPPAHAPMQTAPLAAHDPAISTSSQNLIVVDGYSESLVVRDLFAAMDSLGGSRTVPAMIGVPIRPADAEGPSALPPALSGNVDSSPITDAAAPSASHNHDTATWHAAAGASAIAADGKSVVPMSTGPNSQAAYYQNSPEFASASSSEGGFVTIDEAAGATTRTSNIASSPSAADSGGDNNGGLTQDGSPSGLKTSSQAIGSDRTAGDRRMALERYSPAHAKASPQSSADFAEVGAIELDDAPPASVVAASSQQATADVAEIRPESGTALLCDMEVAVGPASGDAQVSQQDPAPVVVLPASAEGRDAANAEKSTDDAPLRRNAPRQTSSSAASNAPLLLGATLLVLARGIRQEPDDQNQQRRTTALKRLWNRLRG